MARKQRKGKSGKGASSVNVDLSGVDTGGKVLPEGQYKVKLVEAPIEDSKSTPGAKYVKMCFEVIEGKHSGYKLYNNCSLQPQALFSLKSVLEAMDYEIPKKSFDLDLKAIIGLGCSVEVAHEKYEGKTKSKIIEFIGDNDSDEDEDIEDMLSELDKDQAKELAGELDIKIPKKTKKLDDIIELILDEADEDDIRESYDELFGDEDEDEDDEDDDDDDDEEDDDDDEEDYSEMSLKELKAECKERGIKKLKGKDKDELIELLEEDDE